MWILHVVTLDGGDGGRTTVATRLAAAPAGLAHQVEPATYSSPGGDRGLRKERSLDPHADLTTYHIYPAPSPVELVFARDARRRGVAPMRGCDFDDYRAALSRRQARPAAAS